MDGLQPLVLDIAVVAAALSTRQLRLYGSGSGYWYSLDVPSGLHYTQSESQDSFATREQAVASALITLLRSDNPPDRQFAIDLLDVLLADDSARTGEPADFHSWEQLAHLGVPCAIAEASGEREPAVELLAPAAPTPVGADR